MIGGEARTESPPRGKRSGRRELTRRRTSGIARIALLGCTLALAASAMTACGASSGSSEARVWPPGGSAVYSPYVDVTLAAPSDLAGVGGDAGARSLTLAFVTAAAGECQAAWGGQTAIGAPTVLPAAERLSAAGVALRVSFGGAQGQELAARCRDTRRLQAEYASVLDRYHAAAADFDLEGSALADRPAMTRRAQALAGLQAQPGRHLTVSLTLPVSPDGLSAPALDAVRAMVGSGVHLGAVNLLAMDYGLAPARGHMAAEAVLALDAAHRQLAALGAGLSSWKSLGVTTMVGVNDVSSEIFTLTDARTLARFGDRHGLALTSIWSLARDQPCPGSASAAQATCSGVAAPRYAFSRAMGARPKPEVRPRGNVD
jgi:hypothetical protein